MNSHLIDDKSIEHILSNVEKYPNNSLENLNYKFNFNFLSIPDSPSKVCEEIVGVDGSIKLITDRISYFNSSYNNYQTYVIDPIIFVRSVSVHSKSPFIKEDRFVMQEDLDQFKLENPDRSIGLKQIESKLLKRREFNHIEEVIKEMSYGSILLLDMALISLISLEDDLKLITIIKKCKEKGINIVGWVKDSDIKTEDGLLYTTAAKVSSLQNDINPPWYVIHPKFMDRDVNVYIYHPPWGNFCFRTDIVPSSLSINEIFEVLMDCSKHSLGYPLVLYKAHNKVKITQNDANNMFRKMKKISASKGTFIDQPGLKPFHESYLDL
jgi:SepF-like predicted cell division protein (DUF552 family)